MKLCTMVRRNYGGKLPASIKYHNLLSFKGGVILLCQSRLETRQILHLYSSDLFTVPLSVSSGFTVLRHFETRALGYLGHSGIKTPGIFRTLAFRLLKHSRHLRGHNLEYFIHLL